MSTAAEAAEVQVEHVTVTDSGVTVALVGGDRIEIDAEELREADWILQREADDYAKECTYEHCGTDDCECLSRGDVSVVIERWHDDNHGIGRMDTCYEQPCKDLRAVIA